MYDQLDLTDPDVRNEAAANYVLGILDANDKARFESLMSVSHDVQAEVQQWREHLDVLNESLQPVKPSADVWNKVKKQITPARMGFWENLRFWQGATLTSMLGMFLFVLVSLQQQSKLPDMDLVYVVSNEAQQTGWIVNASMKQEKLYVETVQPDDLPEGKVCELWLAKGDNEFISVGILPKSGIMEVKVPKDWMHELSNAKLIVSVEESGGAKPGTGMGPVVNKGNWQQTTY